MNLLKAIVNIGEQNTALNRIALRIFESVLVQKTTRLAQYLFLTPKVPLPNFILGTRFNRG